MKHEKPGDFVPECAPTFTLDRQIAAAKAGMTAERWQQLQREWSDHWTDDKPPVIEGEK